MLENLNLPTLESRRNRTIVQMMYKITNNQVCILNVGFPTQNEKVLSFVVSGDFYTD